MKPDSFIQEAKSNYQQAVDGWCEIYDQLGKDMRFVYDIDSGQWPDDIKKERTDERRPMLTLNKILKFVWSLRGDALQNRPRMKVIPVDNEGDVKMAKRYNGLIREIEYLSDAPTAYDTAYAHAIASSVGFFRLVTEFEPGTFNSVLKIERILNPTSVHFDPRATKFELEDARYCFIEEFVKQEEFKSRWPNASTSHFSGMGTKLYGDWLQGKNIRVAEYFYKNPVRSTLVQLDDGQVLTLSKDMTKEYIRSHGRTIVRDRVEQGHEVKWVKMNGIEVLEEGIWPGNDIPIIPVFGDEIVVEGKKHYLSFFRGAKDAQRMYNFWATAATETVALAPKMPFIVDHRQIKGFETEWEEANRANRMYIRYNAIQGMTKPSREQGTEIPAAIMSMMRSTAFDIEDHLGRYEASKGQQGNERSKVAIVARIKQSDKGAYAFADNFKKAIVYATRQMIDLIPKVYDTQRSLRIMDEAGNETLESFNKPTMGIDGEPEIQNNLAVGKYDLIATIGASFGSKREEMVDTMIKCLQFAPEFAAVIAPLVFKFSDMEGADEIHQALKEHARKLEMQARTQGSGKVGPQSP